MAPELKISDLKIQLKTFVLFTETSAEVFPVPRLLRASQLSDYNVDQYLSKKNVIRLQWNYKETVAVQQPTLLLSVRLFAVSHARLITAEWGQPRALPAATTVSREALRAAVGLSRARSHTGALSCPVIYKIDPAKSKQRDGEWCDLNREEWSKQSSGIPGLWSAASAVSRPLGKLQRKHILKHGLSPKLCIPFPKMWPWDFTSTSYR